MGESPPKRGEEERCLATTTCTIHRSSDFSKNFSNLGPMVLSAFDPRVICEMLTRCSSAISRCVLRFSTKSLIINMREARVSLSSMVRNNSKKASKRSRLSILAQSFKKECHPSSRGSFFIRPLVCSFVMLHHYTIICLLFFLLK